MVPCLHHHLAYSRYIISAVRAVFFVRLLQADPQPVILFGDRKGLAHVGAEQPTNHATSGPSGTSSPSGASSKQRRLLRCHGDVLQREGPLERP